MKTDNSFYNFYQFLLPELKKTRFYQEAWEEGYREGFKEGFKQVIERVQLEVEVKLKMVPRLLQRGFSIEELAELLELDIETVRRATQEQS